METRIYSPPIDAPLNSGCTTAKYTPAMRDSIAAITSNISIPRCLTGTGISIVL